MNQRGWYPNPPHLSHRVEQSRLATDTACAEPHRRILLWQPADCNAKWVKTSPLAKHHESQVGGIRLKTVRLKTARDEADGMSTGVTCVPRMSRQPPP